LIFRAHQVTRYRYSRPAFLEPQIVRLTPRSDPAQRLTDFRIDFTPEPAGVAQYLDAEGNSVVKAWFEGLTDSLIIHSRFLARTLRSNPFEFLLEGDADYRLPIVYRGPEAAALERFLVNGSRVGAATANYTQDVMEAARGETLRFLHGLNQRIYEEFRIVLREEGDAYSAEETLGEREAASRDVANLFIECARVVGLAARFVSGYQAGDPDQTKSRLHAWAEVYLPGAGWIGYDPTHGLAVADAHVAVAAAPTPAGAAPLTGWFRGTDVESAIETSLNIDVMRG
jgi:transglutaminase-like putative cysteine protease